MLHYTLHQPKPATYEQDNAMSRVSVDRANLSLVNNMHTCFVMKPSEEMVVWWCAYCSSAHEDTWRFGWIITDVSVEQRRQHTSCHRRLLALQRSPVITAAMYKLHHHV